MLFLLKFLWASTGRMAIALSSQSVKDEIKRHVTDGKDLEEILAKNLYDAFFLSFISAEGGSKVSAHQIDALKKEFRLYISDENYIGFINIIKQNCHNNLDRLLDKLASKSTDFIDSLAQDIYLHYKFQLDAIQEEVPNPKDVLKIVLHNYYDEIIKSSNDKQYRVLTESKYKKLENILSSHVDGFRHIFSLENMSEINAKNLSIIERGGQQYDNEKSEVNLSNLYIKRDIEEEILHDLENSQRSYYLIKGEAGNGKSSLLWSLHQNLKNKAKMRVWLVKATHLESIDIYKAIHFISDEDIEPKQNILLIDTVDNLVIKEESLIHFSNLIGLLSTERNVKIVFTSRPHEAQIILNYLSGSLQMNQYRLGNYSFQNEESELNRAIAKYVKFYYKFYEGKEDVSMFYNHIVEVVSNGRSLRELCLNPLKLRMLFSLYTPDKIPQEINTFDLYEKYWTNKIFKDVRGSLDTEATIKDLSYLTKLIAAKMLINGKPFTSKTDIESLDNRNELKDLISRGVVTYEDSERGQIEMFHQTFFEFSSALALYNFNDVYEKLIELSLNEKTAISNFFLLPILEFAMLKREKEYGVTIIQANLIKLLDHPRQYENIVALRIFILLKSNSQYINELVISKFAKTYNTDVIISFLKMAINYQDDKIQALFPLLEVIWNRDKTDLTIPTFFKEISEKNNILVLLKELSTKFSIEVSQFVIDNNIVDFYVQPNLNKKHDPLSRILVELVSNTNEINIDFCREALLSIFVCKKENDLRLTILNELSKPVYDFVDLPLIIKNLCPDQKYWPILAKETHYQLFPKLGQLWMVYWTKNNYGIKAIQASIDNCHELFHKKSMIYGLSPFFASERLNLREVLIELEESDLINTDKDKLDILLRTGLNFPVHRESAHEYIIDHIQKLLDGKNTFTTNDEIIYSSLESVLFYTNLDISTFLFSDKSKSEPETLNSIIAWSDIVSKLGARVYSNLILNENEVAINHLVNSYVSVDESKFWHTLSVNLSHESLYNVNVSEYYFEIISMLSSKLKTVSTFFDKSIGPNKNIIALKEIIERNFDSIRDIALEGIESDSGKTRKLGYQIIKVMMTIGQKDIFHYDEFYRFYQEETNTECHKECFAIFNSFFISQPDARSSIITALEAASGLKKIGEDALYYYLLCLSRDELLLQDQDINALTIQLTSDIDTDQNARRLYLIINVFNRYINMDIEKAKKFLDQFSKRIYDIDFNKGILKKLAHKLRPSFINLIEKSKVEDFSFFISLLHQMRRDIGVTWISSIFSRVNIYSYIEKDLIEISNSNKIESFVKLEINNQLAKKQKRQGDDSSIDLGSALMQQLIKIRT